MGVHARRRSFFFLLAFCLASALAIGVYWQSGNTRRLAARAKQAELQGNHRLALRLAERLLQSDPDSLQARRTAMKSAGALGQIDEMMAHLHWLEAAGRLTASDCLLMGETSLRAGSATIAERYLRQALVLSADLHPARSQLIELLSIQCRAREANQQRRELLRQGVWSPEHLMYLAKPEDLLESDDLEFLLERDPQNVHLHLAKARQAKLKNEVSVAQQWLDRALQVKPDFLEAHAERGLLMLEKPNWQNSFADWYSRLPENADDSPDVWVVYGMWARQQGDHRAAIRCFGEALNRDPNYRLATHQLAIALSAIGEESAAAKLSARVTQLDELARATDDIYDAPDSLIHWVQAAESLELLGRHREAFAWYNTISRMVPARTEFRIKAQELQTELAVGASTEVTDATKLAGLDLNRFPRPSFPAISGEAPGPALDKKRQIRFADVADTLGLDFTFVNADKPVKRGRRLFEIFGAGMAVLDYDLDGWPEVYLAQGAPAGDELQQRQPLVDQLFQSQHGAGFVQTTNKAFLNDAAFGQGVSAGDFNNDGFPDLLVANVGENRLYQNNGDGTFSDATPQAGIAGSFWTTSCAIADLNGDTWPDLYEVNYLGGPDIFSVVCDDPQRLGGPSCRPRDFPSEDDRFFLGQGDGRFIEATVDAGLVAPEGKGLGIIIADFAGDGRLSVFIANDTTANFFYQNTAQRGQTPAFEERAALAGLAFDRNGLTQACMGAAAEDIDADGYLDLFVTNFTDEPNTLYRGLSPQHFDDATRAAGLYLPSLPLLGFGTQFLDADLDGDADLVIANGHITSHQVAHFQMRPQFFENRNGVFVERPGSDVAEYFDRELLGRAVARFDFNRDGREDFIVSHLDAPTALLQNASLEAGHYLTVRLVGVAGDRDAIGTTVTVVTDGGAKHVRQLTAGDGYQTSNQRQLVFGLGDAATVSRLLVRWPSGLELTVVDVGADRELLVIEGRDGVVELH